MALLYSLLQDEMSRSLFWVRLQVDLEPSMSQAVQLLQVSERYTEEEITALRHWKSTFQKLRDAQKQILLYGAGNLGQLAANLILKEGEDFFAFCDRQASNEKEVLNLLGKPVYPPDYLFENMQQCYVVITTTDYYEEIEQFLIQNGFPQEHILPLGFESSLNRGTDIHDKQYFDFPELYQKGTTFVDAGCFDGKNSIHFAKWCKGEYESILAFEPDVENCKICERNIQEAGIDCFRLIQAGLSSRREKVKFTTGLDSANYVQDDIVQQGDVLVVRGTGCVKTIQTDRLDEYTRHLTVGFIKMDIEGSELSALQGAEDTIKRDKPFMAVSIYHRRGDVLAIMDYLHQLVPDYRFRIRHYGPLVYDTVLFASVL